MELVIALLVAGAVAMAAYQFMPLPSGHWGKSLNATLSTEQAGPPLPFWRASLTALGPAVKLTPMGWIRMVEGQLYWAQLAGKWQGWALPEVVALHIALAAIGFLAGSILIGDVVMTVLATLLAPALMNMAYLRGPGRKARRQLGAELPEFVSLLAAEVGADIAMSEAVVRLSRGPGVCAAWFRRVLNMRGVGGMFTESGTPGALREEALRSGDSDLIGLATSLDNVKRRGTGARELLAQIAVSTAARYVGDANVRAEKVGNEMLLPMMVFFFLPYAATLILVMASPLFSSGPF